MSEPELVLSPAVDASAPRTKRPPDTRMLSTYAYTPSDDGTDENLLILLHGLGDTHKPFSNLARQLKLPQTATLALCAPQQLPYLLPDEEGFQWYPAFDALGEPLAHPDPTPALTFLERVLSHLTGACGWPASRVHMFGFAQGGTAALEFGLRHTLGSIVSVSGPLLSFPASAANARTTPVLALGPPQTAVARAYAAVRVERAPPNGRMPASRAEWEPIMRFWSEHLSRRAGEGLYEVLGGMAPPR